MKIVKFNDNDGREKTSYKMISVKCFSHDVLTNNGLTRVNPRESDETKPFPSELFSTFFLSHACCNNIKNSPDYIVVEAQYETGDDDIDFNYALPADYLHLPITVSLELPPIKKNFYTTRVSVKVKVADIK